MKFHKKYCSYYPALIDAFINVDGDVLELGAGIHSTFLLNWLCLERNRELVTYENSAHYYNMVKHCERVNRPTHKIYLVDDWDDAKIERAWGVALIDHAPAIRRKTDIARLAYYARCLVVHDTQGRSRKHYHYEEIYPLFKYIKGYNKERPHSVVLSNYIDLGKW